MGEIPFRRDGDEEAAEPKPGLSGLLRAKGGRIAGVLLLLVLAAGYAAWQGLSDLRNGEVVDAGADPASGGSVTPVATGAVAAASAPAPTPETLRIDLVGAVLHPGIYEIPKGSCLDDLVRLAGGFTNRADVDRINLVWRIEKSLMIRIGERAATATGGAPGGAANESGAGAAVVVTDQVSISGNGSGAGESSGPIDLNTATVAQLDALPGIGPSTAAAIVAYREKNGPFAKTEDLMKVSGIKQSRYDAVKDLVCVG